MVSNVSDSVINNNMDRTKLLRGYVFVATFMFKGGGVTCDQGLRSDLIIRLLVTC
jgi:hypothetical protein